MRIFGIGRRKKAKAKQIPSFAPTTKALSKKEAAHAGAGATFKDDGSVVLKVRSAADAKVALQQLKLKKRELAVEKKAINTQLAQMRAAHQIKLGNRGSMMRGGGKVGKFVRAVEQGSRDIDRAQYANQLLPLEQAKARVDARMLNVESSIVEVQRYMTSNT